jgi:hypothetical protein
LTAATAMLPPSFLFVFETAVMMCYAKEEYAKGGG